jgi:hypothetical protein
MVPKGYIFWFYRIHWLRFLPVGPGVWQRERHRAWSRRRPGTGCLVSQVRHQHDTAKRPTARSAKRVATSRLVDGCRIAEVQSACPSWWNHGTEHAMRKNVVPKGSSPDHRTVPGSDGVSRTRLLPR